MYNYNILFDVALDIGTFNKLLFPFLSTYGHYIFIYHNTYIYALYKGTYIHLKYSSTIIVPTSNNVQ